MTNIESIKVDIGKEIIKLELGTKDTKELQKLYNWYSKCFYFRDRRLNPGNYCVDGSHTNSHETGGVNAETIYYSGVAAGIYNYALDSGVKLKFWKLYSAHKTKTRWTSRELK